MTCITDLSSTLRKLVLCVIKLQTTFTIRFSYSGEAAEGNGKEAELEDLEQSSKEAEDDREEEESYAEQSAVEKRWISFFLFVFMIDATCSFFFIFSEIFI